jgi:hypothetical protein
MGLIHRKGRRDLIWDQGQLSHRQKEKNQPCTGASGGGEGTGLSAFSVGQGTERTAGVEVWSSVKIGNIEWCQSWKHASKCVQSCLSVPPPCLEKISGGSCGLQLNKVYGCLLISSLPLFGFPKSCVGVWIYSIVKIDFA